MFDWRESLALAYELATQSPDPSNQNGAVLYDKHRGICGTGYNHYPDGFSPTDESREERMLNIEHAERAALYCAAAVGGYGASVLVCPWAACMECARGIVMAGVLTLVVHQDRMLLTPDRWQASVGRALASLERAGVTIERVGGSIPYGGRVLVNGRLWSPQRLQWED